MSYEGSKSLQLQSPLCHAHTVFLGYHWALVYFGDITSVCSTSMLPINNYFTVIHLLLYLFTVMLTKVLFKHYFWGLMGFLIGTKSIQDHELECRPCHCQPWLGAERPNLAVLSEWDGWLEGDDQSPVDHSGMYVEDGRHSGRFLWPCNAAWASAWKDAVVSLRKRMLAPQLVVVACG